MAVLVTGLLVLVSACTAHNDTGSDTPTPSPTAGVTTSAAPDRPSSFPPSASGPYPVVTVTDGDTIRVNVDGAEEKVRLIGIDTPELHNPVECFGQEAADEAAALLQGAVVLLEADDSQDDRDRYGRLLRYVYLPDGTNVNAALVRDGYAFEYTYDNPYRYREEFLADQAAAEADGAGLWSAATCGGRPIATSSSPACTLTTASPQEIPPGCPIKGNINTKGEKIFHQPGDASYADTVITPSKGERFFCSVEEAIAAGWRAPRN